MSADNAGQPLDQLAAKYGIGHFHRHVFLCTGPSCCTPEVGFAAWEELKNQLKDRGLSLSTGPNACYRTKAGCLRICTGGPIACVYPEGTWYHGLTADKIGTFVERHLERGEPIGEWIFARNPLPLVDDAS